MQARTKLLAVSGVVVAAALAAIGLTALISGAGGATVGAVTPRGCIDDNDTGLGQGPDNCGASTNGLDSSNSVAMSRDGKSVYVVSEGSDAIVRFKRNRDTGALTPRGCVDDNDDPAQGPDNCGTATNGMDGVTSIALSRDGKWLYAASEFDDAIVRFKRNRDTGALAPRGCIDDNDTGTDPNQGPDSCGASVNGLNGASSVALSADGKSLYAASEEDDAVVRFKRNTDTGALTPRGCIDDNDFDAVTNPFEGEDSCGSSANGLGQAGGLVVSPDGKSLYGISEGSFGIFRFARNGDTGALTPKGCLEDNDGGPDSCGQTAAGLQTPQALAVSADGTSLYVVSDTDNALVRFDRDRRGRLTARGCVEDNDVGPDSCGADANGMEELSSVTVSRDGKSVYATSGVDDAIVRFRRNVDTGAVAPRGCVDDNDFGTDVNQGPDNCADSTNGMDKTEGVVVSRDGKSVYVTSEADDAIVRFRRATG